MKGHRVCADSFLCVLIRESLFMGKGGCISTVRCDFLHSKGVFTNGTVHLAERIVLTWWDAGYRTYVLQVVAGAHNGNLLKAQAFGFG